MSARFPIRVAVHGAAGRVGREVLRAVESAPDLELAAAVDAAAPERLPEGVPHYANAADALRECPCDVVIDFTNAAAALDMAPHALAAGARPVIGSTGFTEAQAARLADLVREHALSGVLAPNFTIGAVLLMRLAAIAARYFDYADIVEEHHETKIDAPSGTALAIARVVHEGRAEPFQRSRPEREPLPGSRGADFEGIAIHAARMPGKMANHQVTFGGLGQTLTLRHETINRECYIPGVLLAARKVGQLDGLVVGLDALLDL
ncbi:MAG: 4-hydroxy-tetrahydrodipicolinate reductase [Chloroflexota bacterium]|nr:4-hydroxy-tetrahydrodipicolinate reductase [Chloroflexota bacterium]